MRTVEENATPPSYSCLGGGGVGGGYRWLIFLVVVSFWTCGLISPGICTVFLSTSSSPLCPTSSHRWNSLPADSVPSWQRPHDIGSLPPPGICRSLGTLSCCFIAAPVYLARKQCQTLCWLGGWRHLCLHEYTRQNRDGWVHLLPVGVLGSRSWSFALKCSTHKMRLQIHLPTSGLFSAILQFLA